MFTRETCLLKGVGTFMKLQQLQKKSWIIWTHFIPINLSETYGGKKHPHNLIEWQQNNFHDRKWCLGCLLSLSLSNEEVTFNVHVF